MVPSPPRRRAGSRRDAVTLLTVYVVLLLAIPAPMTITVLGQVGGPATIVALACFLWWGLSAVTRHGPATPVSRTVRTAALAYLAVALVAYTHSALLALPVDERSPADSDLLRTLGFVGLVCVLATRIPGRARLWRLVERISLAMGLLAVLAIAQMVTQQTLVDHLSIPGLSPMDTEGLIVRGTFTRPSGTSTHPIEFAAVLAMGLPLVLAASGPGRPRRRLHLAVAVVLAAVILMTGSRTAIVCGATAFLGMLPAWSLRVRLAASGLSVAMLAAMFVAMPGAVGTLRGLFTGAANDSSVQSRTNSYAVVLEFWQEHLWLGRGMGTFLPKYWILDNQYLQVLLGAGIVGVVALLWLVVSAVRATTRASRRLVRPDDRQLALAVRASVLAGAVSLALFDAFGFAQSAGMFFVVLGLSGAVDRLAAQAAPPAPPASPAPAARPVERAATRG